MTDIINLDDHRPATRTVLQCECGSIAFMSTRERELVCIDCEAYNVHPEE
jgi:hypothetical protein